VPRPTASNLDVAAGQETANSVTVAVRSGGRVRLHNGYGAVHLVADLAGYYAPSAEDVGSGRSGSADGRATWAATTAMPAMPTNPPHHG